MQIRKWFGASLLLIFLAALALIPWLACAQTSCPEGCSCITVAGANQQFGEGNFDRCQANPCGEERSPTGAMLLKYCFKSKCPQGCSCMTEEKAKEMGYNLCSGQRIPCGYDQFKRPLYCFSPAVRCPDDCQCLTEEGAKKLGYDKFCGNEKKECGKDRSRIRRPSPCSASRRCRHRPTQSFVRNLAALGRPIPFPRDCR